MANTAQLPLSGAKPGQRLAISILDERAQSDPQSPWVSVPVDDEDLSKGYTDITYSQFANAVNHATHWLARSLPSSQEPFQCFAYVGPKDLRYPILAMAAGKLGKVVCYTHTSVYSSITCSICSVPERFYAKYLLCRRMGIRWFCLRP